MRLYLLCFLLLQSCAFRSYIYSKIPSYTKDKLDDELDYTWSEEDLVEKRIEKKLLDLRPKIYSFKETLEETNLTKASLLNLDQAYGELFDELSVFISELVVEKILIYSKDDFLDFVERQNEKNKQILEKSQKEASKLKKNLSKLFDDLSIEQIQMIETFSKSSKKRVNTRVQSRKLTITNIEWILKTKYTRADKKKELMSLFFDQSKLIRERNRVYLSFMISFIETVSEKQKIYFFKKKKEFVSYIKEYLIYLEKLNP